MRSGDSDAQERGRIEQESCQALSVPEPRLYGVAAAFSAAASPERAVVIDV